MGNLISALVPHRALDEILAKPDGFARSLSLAFFKPEDIALGNIAYRVFPYVHADDERVYIYYKGQAHVYGHVSTLPLNEVRAVGEKVFAELDILFTALQKHALPSTKQTKKPFEDCATFVTVYGDNLHRLEQRAASFTRDLAANIRDEYNRPSGDKRYIGEQAHISTPLAEDDFAIFVNHGNQVVQVDRNSLRFNQYLERGDLPDYTFELVDIIRRKHSDVGIRGVRPHSRT